MRPLIDEGGHSQNTFLLADFCMVYMFSFDSNMF